MLCPTAATWETSSLPEPQLQGSNLALPFAQRTQILGSLTGSQPPIVLGRITYVSNTRKAPITGAPTPTSNRKAKLQHIYPATTEYRSRTTTWRPSGTYIDSPALRGTYNNNLPIGTQDTKGLTNQHAR